MLFEEVLKEAVQFTYCPEDETWFWTIDNTHWCHVSVISWQWGPNKGQSTNSETLSIMKVNNVYTCCWIFFKTCFVGIR